MYVGLSKTNNNDVDFDYYESYEIDGYNLSGADSIDFNLTPTEVGEYYFKIVLVHNNSNQNYNIYAELSDLTIRTINSSSDKES